LEGGGISEKEERRLTGTGAGPKILNRKIEGGALSALVGGGDDGKGRTLLI